MLRSSLFSKFNYDTSQVTVNVASFWFRPWCVSSLAAASPPFKDQKLVNSTLNIFKRPVIRSAQEV